MKCIDVRRNLALCLRWFGATAMALALAPLASAAVDLNEQGLTGAWYEPATSGQGIMLEIYPNAVGPGIGLVQGTWLTVELASYWDDYEGGPNQRWYTFAGTAAAGQTSAKLTLYQNVGGNFNALPVTTAQPVGTAVLTVADCTTATLEYTLAGAITSHGTLNLTRLMPNITCAKGGDSVARADFAYSGHWFDPATAGQGFAFEMNATSKLLFFSWSTYAAKGVPSSEPGAVTSQRWYTGQGNYTPGARSVPVALYQTTNGYVGESGVGTYVTEAVGSATATFENCGAAQLTFGFTGGINAAASGTITLSRVGPTPADCDR